LLPAGAMIVRPRAVPPMILMAHIRPFLFDAN
jgi:hypothetical protein